MTLHCEDCGTTSSRVSLCQGDLQLCQKCNKKRFGSNHNASNSAEVAGRHTDHMRDNENALPCVEDKATTSSMSSTTAAYSAIIVNEVLCFLANKMDIMPNNILLKVSRMGLPTEESLRGSHPWYF